MFKKLCILLVITTISLTAVAGTTNKKAQKYFDNALESIKKENLEKAEKQLLKAIEKDNGFFEAYMELGKMSFKQGKFENCEKYLVKAVEVNKEGADEAYDTLFNIALKQKNIENQSKWILAKLDVKKENLSDKDAHNVVVVAFNKSRNGDLKSAQSMFKKLIKVKPNFLEGYFFSGVIYINNKMFKEAAVVFQEAFDKNVVNDDLLNTLSMIYNKELKNNEKAIPVYEKLVSNKQSKYRKDALIDLINIYIEKKNNEKALELSNLFLQDYKTDKFAPGIESRIEKLKHNIEVEKKKKEAESKK